jgi:hypothetical protein
MNPRQIIENSLHIAWNYLEAMGELGNTEVASQMLPDEIHGMMRRGETSPPDALKQGVEAYKKHSHRLALVS